MKTLILLFACLAAVNAVSYVAPPACYQTWNIGQFCVFPSFKFSVYYSGSWFSNKYYADVLKVYPDDSCDEMSEDDFKDDCAEKLTVRLTAICDDMQKHYDQWKADLKAAVDAAKEEYAQKVTEYYTGFIRYVWDTCARDTYYTRKVTAIEEYNDRIDEMYRNAVDCYFNAIDKMHKRIVAFHIKILDNAVKAFRIRLEKISEFENNLYDRMVKYVNTFKDTMAKIIEKRADAYRALLIKVHCDSYWMKDYVDCVVDLFRKAQYEQCYSDADNYWAKLMTVREKMIKNYRCNYRIVTYCGVLSLATKQYQTFCQSLGTWWTCKIDRTIPCFRYVHYSFSWKPCQYKNLVSCDVDAVNRPVDDFKADMEAKAKAAVDAAVEVFAAWKTKWVQYHVEYFNKYVEIVEQRHEFLCQYYQAQIYCRYNGFCGYYVTQFDAYKQSLEERKNEAIARYQAMLDKRIVDACATFDTRVAKYKKTVDEMVAKVVAAYSAAIAIRNAKIAEYKEKQEELRNKMRAALESKLSKIADLKCDQYYDMMMFYHPGAELYGKVDGLFYEYKYKVWAEYDHYLGLFDAHWNDLLPKLVMHYSCGYKVTYGVKFCVPRLSCAFYNWQYVLPTYDCYPYELACYNTYCDYRLVKVGCQYYYKVMA